jgi:hypothetical protein
LITNPNSGVVICKRRTDGRTDGRTNDDTHSLKKEEEEEEEKKTTTRGRNPTNLAAEKNKERRNGKITDSFQQALCG